MTILFIFRRDLRTYDNTALNHAIQTKEDVLPIFIFTPEQVQENDYKSDNSVKFMINSLKSIHNLQCFYGTNIDVIVSLTKKLNITHIFFNTDTTHYAIKRDKQIEGFCNNSNIICKTYSDYNLVDILFDVKTGSDTYYSVFTPFLTKSKQLEVRLPESSSKPIWYDKHIKTKYQITLEEAERKFTKNASSNVLVHGGRNEAMKLLKQSLATQKKYKITRNQAYTRTTLLSAHIKFGTISIREAYYHFKKNNMIAIIDQLYWNEFYDYLMVTLPKKKTIGGSNFKGKSIQWDNDKENFDKWKAGQTGFPFIDAGMRQLNREGYMHGRARMAVANFLSMILLIDWRKGEKYFATKLIDYDIAQNNGNWQWSVGLGVDKTGYLRIFNPYTQSKRHDPDCLYIKKYVPELSDVPNEDIHKWEVKHKMHETYITPIVDYPERRKVALHRYKQ